MSNYWLAGLALMLVLEGMMPFLFPKRWREILSNLSKLHDGQARFVGLSLMMSGLLLIYWIK